MMANGEVTEVGRRHGIQVVARVADVLRALERAPEGLGLTELSTVVEMPKSTVHRLVGALESEDFLRSDGLGRIRLGPALARLGAATRGGLRDQMHPHLVRLHQELGETVDLSVLDDASARFVDHIPAPHRLRAVSAVGTSFPLHCTANGKAFLASMSDEQASALLPARLPALTDHTITARKDLWADLERVRVDGVAYDREEHTVGICAIGAIIRDPYGPAASLSVPVPAQRFSGNESRIADALLKTTAECSLALGAS
jgi:DNA-binding IclR family transcriptional regulator